MSTQYAIKDLERLSGIKAHTLRIWEQRYGILKPERTDTNIRYYTSDDLKKILNISLLNNNGFKISKIAKLPDEEIIKQVQSILNNYNKESDQIDNLVLCMMEMNEPKFEKIISNCIIHFGFESTIEKIVFPFLRQIGNMWQVGIVNPAQEHFISNLVRQKLIVGIDGLFPEPLANPKTFLLYLPDNELHELGLLYCHFLIKSKGHKCLYLGQSVSFNDLVSVSHITPPDAIVTTFTNRFENISIQEYINNMSTSFPNSSIMVSGRVFFDENEPIELPKNVILFESHEQFKNVLQSVNFVFNVYKPN
ncbi:MAG: MerR family transcriptional regulator [Bacteroidetes bacterium]|nr:MerR family transcriptional regulator [Bacteroidota bacterium]